MVEPVHNVDEIVLESIFWYADDVDQVELLVFSVGASFWHFFTDIVIFLFYYWYSMNKRSQIINWDNNASFIIFGGCWRNITPLARHLLTNRCNELHFFLCPSHILPLMILGGHFWPFLDHGAHIILSGLGQDCFGEPPQQCMGHWSSTLPIDCIRAQHFYKLPRIPALKIHYLTWRTIKPEHLHCTNFKPSFQDLIHYLSHISFRNHMRLDNETGAAIEVSWALERRFIRKEKLQLSSSRARWIASMSCIFRSFCSKQSSDRVWFFAFSGLGACWA